MHIDGVLNLNKPSAITSRQAVDRVKYLLKVSKAGHAGTLDPSATGVLLICLGRGTKLFDWFQRGSKEYEGTITLGVTTDSLDASGNIRSILPVSQAMADDVRMVAERFVGEIEQTVPIFSAVRRRGKRLYKLAHRGVECEELPKRIVQITSLEILSVRHSEVRFRVVCSKGTYIRVLAADIGMALGCGAHLSQLTRTRSGHFTLDSAHTLDWLEKHVLDAYKAIVPVESVHEMGTV